ncbi:AAA family ATPase [Bernardetia sp. Wsw4-3y2]|uniref:AAA family ATPase n=1 Tax=Bernardetia sp. Wsw4-3y2 TaxID=3127471 RepID=UPI0030CF6783
MQLLYLWIEDYKNIKQQGFNFSPLYDFHFEPDKPDENGKIVSGTLTDKITDEDRKKKAAFYEDFFGENISNVTAIVGANGAGKSSLIKFLFSEIFEKNCFIMIYGNTIFHNKVEINNHLNFYDKIDLNKSSFRELNGITNILFQNAYTAPINVYNHPNFINISSTEIFMDAHYYTDRGHPTDKNFVINLNHHIKYKIGFINNLLRSKSSSFNLIDEFTYFQPIKHLKVTLPALHDFLEYIEQVVGVDDKIQNLHSFFTNSWDSRMGAKFKNREELLTIIYHIAILGAIQHRFTYYGSSQTNILKKIDDITPILYDNSISISTKYNLIKEKNSNSIWSISFELADRVINLIDEVKIFDNFFLININQQEVFSVVKDFFISFYHSNFNIDFANNEGNEIILSNGEEALSTFFLRLINIDDYAMETEFSINSVDYITILIDEGELGLHPQWQKQYLKILLETLPKIFPDKEIQLILTSHSPFLVSDLPKENVIFLEKEKDTGLCKVSKLESMKHTFGANIHTLLTDSFFMKGGLVGEFAQSKIDEAIDILNESEPKPKELDKCEMIISMIGEPIVKTMLQKLLDSKRLRKVDKHSTEIEELKARIHSLESILKNDNPV